VPVLNSLWRNVCSSAGVSDETKCFHCNGGIKDWEPQDEPWFEHAKWYPTCVHVNLVKGREFVENVRKGVKTVISLYNPVVQI
jgi:hypothetical protein